jgi:hypothetical protein
VKITDSPPVQDIPVAVLGDLVLLAEAGLLVWAGAFEVSSAGFEFTLRITADVGNPAVTMPAGVALHREDRAHDTWLELTFPDGQSCGADLSTNTWSGDPGAFLVKFVFGAGPSSDGEACWRWWVSPLPPPGVMKLTIHLNGSAGKAGTAALDVQPLLDAAKTVERLQS